MEKQPNRYKLVKRNNNTNTNNNQQQNIINIREIITSIKRSLYNDIDARAKYWMEQRIGLLLNNNALMKKNTTELKIDYDNNSGGLSWLFKYNGQTVAYIDGRGYLYCSNILLNGVNLSNAINNIISINNDLNNLSDIFVRHVDLKNGTYKLNVLDILTDTFKASGRVDIDGAVFMNATLSILGPCYCQNILTVSNNASFNNKLLVNGETKLNDTLTVSGSTTLNDTLLVVGATILNDSLEVINATTLQNALTVAGSTTLNDALNVSGATTLNDILSVNAATSLNDTLSVVGATILNDSLEVINATTLQNALTVAGEATLNDALTVDGATTLNDTLTVDGATTLNDTLTVEGATILNDSLDVINATTLNNSLTVAGSTTLNDTLTVNSGATIQNDLSVGNDVNISNDLVVNGTITCSTLIDSLFKTIYPVGAVFLSYDSFHDLGYNQTSTSPVQYTWHGCVWEFMNNEVYLRNGKVIGTYEQAGTSSGGSETFSLSTNNIPQHTHTFTGTSATGRIVIRSSTYSTVNTASGVFSVEANSGTYNTQLEIVSDPGNCRMQNVNFSYTPAGSLSNVGQTPPDAITHIPPYRTVFMYRRIQ